MKKTLSLVCGMLLLVPAFAQKFYVNASAGYALPVGSTMLINGFPQNHRSPGNAIEPLSSAFTVDNASHAAGTHLVLGAGVWVNKNFGAEINGDVALTTKKYTGTTTYTGISVTSTQQAIHPVFANVLAVLRNEDLVKNFCIKAGVVMPVFAKIVTENTSVPGQFMNTYSKVEMKTRFSIGMHTALCYSYPLTSNLSVGGVISYTAISLLAKESRLVACTVNGKDVLDTVEEPLKKVVYEKGSTGVGLSAGATTLPAYKIPFSNFAARLGVTFTL